MRNIEKSLTNYVRGKGPIISEEILCDYADKSADDMINILFKIINDELDSVTGVDSLDKVRELFNCISIVLNNSDDVNRKVVIRKLHKLDEKIDRIKSENKKKFVDIDQAYSELESIREELETVEKQTEKKETNQYDFINYLATTVKNITYLEYTFEKMPNLVNVKDKDDVSLFRNLIGNYIDNVVEANDEEVLYYSNLLSLMMSQKSFNMDTIEKRKTLDTIYSSIDKLSIKKKETKKNRDKIEWLTNMSDSIKGEDTRDTRIDILANKYNIHIHFDQDLLEQARLVRTPKIGEMTDRVVYDDYIITIDGANAIEVDDALSCRKLSNGNYLLGVHIASILGYFPYESEIVDEAISRNRSIYLPRKYQTREDDFNRTIPIFPYDFSAKTASLIPGTPKLARSYIFEIDKEGNVVKENFLKTIITSNRKTTYEEINEVLKHGSKDKRLQETVATLEEVTELLDRRYKGEELYENVKANTEDYSDLRVKRIGSEKIVYQAMMLTGNRVAEYFADPSRDYPCLYRVHEINEENDRKLKSMVENLTKTYGGDQYKRLYQLIEGIYPKGWYDTVGSHEGLGLEHYCHCTSGLRRAADIIVEHALEICYDKEPTDRELAALQEEIERRKVEINSKQDPMEWFVKDYKRAYQRRH